MMDLSRATNAFLTFSFFLCTFLFLKEKYQKKQTSVPLDRLRAVDEAENIAAFAPRLKLRRTAALVFEFCLAKFTVGTPQRWLPHQAGARAAAQRGSFRRVVR